MAGVGLHAAHHLAGLAAVPVGAARYLGLFTRAPAEPAEELRLELHDGFDTLEEEWPPLAERAGNLFTSWEWGSTWWRHHGHGRRLLLVACHDPGGQLVAILPLYLASDRRVRTLRLLGNGAANQLGLVCAPEDRPRAANALRSFLEGPQVAWDVFLADDLPGDEQWDVLLAATPVRRATSPLLPGA